MFMYILILCNILSVEHLNPQQFNLAILMNSSNSLVTKLSVVQVFKLQFYSEDEIYKHTYVCSLPLDPSLCICSLITSDYLKI